MATKTKTKKKFTYYVSASFKHEGKDQNYMTQLYQIGIYIIWNNSSAMQGSMVPSGMVNLKKKLQKDFEAGKITDLEFGREITVTTDDDGFWKEVKD